MEGAVTIAVAFVAFFLLHDSPETAKFLTPEEKAWAIERVKYSAQGRMAGEVGKAEEVTEKLQWKYIKAGLTDWQIWLAIPVSFEGENVRIERNSTDNLADHLGLSMSVVRDLIFLTDYRKSIRLYCERESSLRLNGDESKQ